MPNNVSPSSTTCTTGVGVGEGVKVGVGGNGVRKLFGEIVGVARPTAAVTSRVGVGVAAGGVKTAPHELRKK
jgi:hypothetical protein